jgi:hypothetical protein
VRTEGWLTGAKDVLEKVIDANMADGVNPGSYKYRAVLGDDLCILTTGLFSKVKHWTGNYWRLRFSLTSHPHL